MARVYLSSTVADLAEHRARVVAALRRAGHDVVAMEDRGARDERPLAACRDDVAGCDVLVCVVAWRYGFRPAEDNPGRLSITELEYRHAGECGRPRLAFLLDEDAPLPPRKHVDHVNGEGERGACIDAFRQQLASERWACRFASAEQLATEVLAALDRHLAEGVAATAAPAAAPAGWSGDPYPGLVTLDERQAAIFFGREAEAGELVERMSAPHGRLLVVVGASGAGKSSLVAAGLLPRLAAGAIPGSERWLVRRILPAEQGRASLKALADGLRAMDTAPATLFESLRDAAVTVDAAIDRALADRDPGAELLLFVDQLEEVFACDDAPAFLDRLLELRAHRRARVVATVRADFFPRCLGHAAFAAALREAAFPLGVPSAANLRQMVREPARLAGPELAGELVERIVADTLGEGGSAEPGALALMAYTLRELWRRREPGAAPGLALYENALGGVEGAIGRRAEQVFDALDGPAREALPHVFRELVTVGAEGVATRRRAPATRFEPDTPAGRLVAALAAADTRLLVRGVAGGEPVVEVAHEALLRSWPRLADWIDEHAVHLQRVREAERAAAGWASHPDSPDFTPWGHERQQLVYESLARLGRDRASEPEPLRGFLLPEAERLCEELADASTPPLRRAFIGEELARIGDPRPGVTQTVEVNGRRLPVIDWVAIPRGTVEFEGGPIEVGAFRMARHALTNVQYRCFIDDGGHDEARWWRGFAIRRAPPREPTWPFANHPRETVSWFEAVAFCRWLDTRLREAGQHPAADNVVRLPAEWEWQQAASGGEADREFPWSGLTAADPERLANLGETRYGRTMAVGLFPPGASAQGLMDMAGNVWEWCQNRHLVETAVSALQVDDSDERRALRGGSWNRPSVYARCTSRDRNEPRYRNDRVGFRVCCSLPIE